MSDQGERMTVALVTWLVLGTGDFSSYGSSTPPPSLVQHLTALAQSRL